MNIQYDKKTCLYINGRFIATKIYNPLYNPFTSEKIADVAEADENSVHEAITAAHHASKGWRSITNYKRSEYLAEIARRLTAEKDYFAAIMSLESGKRIVDSLNEVQASIDNFIWYSEEIKRINSVIIPSRTNSTQLVIREPLGVVGLITPWNFPLNLVTRKLAPALAAGNTVVLKPSSETPLCAYELCRLIDEAGLPEGVVNLVTGSSTMINTVFAKRIEVRKVSFTGSTSTGKKIYQSGVQTIKKLSLELGGNAPFIVFDDADIQHSARLLVDAKLRNMGQVCTNPNRIFVHESIMRSFEDELKTIVSNLSIGHPFDHNTDVGCLINTKAVERMSSLVEDAQSHGGRIVVSQGSFKKNSASCPLFVIADAAADARLYREEIFGPIINLISFKDDDDVLIRANELEYGLASYIFTHVNTRINHFIQNLEFGLVGVNEIVVSTGETPFGGIKLSGFGRENGKYGLDEYLEYKFVNIVN